MEISSVCSNSKTHARLSAGPLLDCTTDQLPSRIARLSPGMESSSLYAIRSVRVKRLSNIRTPRPAARALIRDSLTLCGRSVYLRFARFAVLPTTLRDVSAFKIRKENY
jgi:hypothetical protein